MRTIAILLFSTVGAWGQGWAPPFCVGQNAALQYGQQGWICTTIAGAPGPQGVQGPVGAQGPQGPAGPPGTSAGLPPQPPPSQCITSNWNGSAWVCVPTDYLTSAPAVGRR